jgi:hypothetical protein
MAARGYKAQGAKGKASPLMWAPRASIRPFDLLRIFNKLRTKSGTALTF